MHTPLGVVSRRQFARGTGSPPKLLRWRYMSGTWDMDMESPPISRRTPEMGGEVGETVPLVEDLLESGTIDLVGGRARNRLDNLDPSRTLQSTEIGVRCAKRRNVFGGDIGP